MCSSYNSSSLSKTDSSSALASCSVTCSETELLSETGGITYSGFIGLSTSGSEDTGNSTTPSKSMLFRTMILNLTT